MITASPGHDTSLFMIGMKLAGSLLFVLALFLIGVWLVRLLQRQKILAPRRTENEIEISSTRSVGPRSQIALVTVAGNSFLVGIAPSGISLLGRIDPSGSRAMPSSGVQREAASRPIGTGFSPPAPAKTSGSEPASFDAAVREALDRIGAFSRERSSQERAGRWTV